MAQSYDHIQQGRLHWLLLTIAVIEVAAVWLLWGESEEGALATRLLLGGMSVVMLMLAVCFKHLRVRHDGQELQVSFGPVPLLRRSVRYADMTEARPGRSSFLEGWGIHLAKGGGWIWNIWGRDCVEITLRSGRLKLGTDDVDGLMAHLQQRIGDRATGPGDAV